ncbi:MAG TPA: TldD/PmbA family protein [Thermoprotei archaeon]|nr:TldD/PmbA family protein [Thermoprotei archaeon]
MDLYSIGDKIFKIIEKFNPDDIAIKIGRSFSQMIRFTNNEIIVSKEWIQTGASIYIGYKKRMLTAGINEFSNKNIENVVENLIKSAKYIEPLEDYVSLPQGPFKYNPIEKCFDKKILEEDLSEKVYEAIESALNSGAKRVAGVLNAGMGEKLLITSSGVKVFDKGTSISITVRAFSNSVASGQGISCSRTLDNFNPSLAGERAGRIAKMAEKSVEGKAGKYMVILDPTVVGNLFNYIMYNLSAFSVIGKVSFFTGKLGMNVASEALNLIDDGRMPGGLGSTMFDDEGIPTQRNILIERGVLRGFLHNTRTAKKFGVKSTGNAGWIYPHAWNIVVEGGEYNKDELFDEVREGIYITNNWYTRYQNIREGIFSSITRDGVFYIRNGEIVNAIRGLRISDSFPNLLKNIQAMTRDKWPIVWWEVETPTYAPYILLRELNLTKATK